MKMNIESTKVELIDWIIKINDQYSLKRILSLKEKLSLGEEKKVEIFGSGKHLIEQIADDFNEPLEDFKEYQ